MSWDDELVTVGRFNHVGEAELARMALEAADIEAVVADEYSARMGGHKGSGGVRVMVQRRDVEAANDALRATEEDFDVTPAHEPPPERDAICRRCSSEEVYPRTSRHVIYARAIFGWMAALILLHWYTKLGGQVPNALPIVFFFAAIGYLAWESIVPHMQCRNCGAEWRGRQL
ncbi:MAG TPA: DUF2007 domain-containing protein [Thermoanaerobaculia bacterium]|nr:DUF2007 domain-containing protein [Thermoanaerobaculia bacterium]